MKFFVFFLSVLLLQQCSNNGEILEIPMEEISFEKNTDGLNLAYYKDKPFTGMMYSLHPNNKRFTEKSYVKGVEAGDWAVYYKNGNKMKSGTIKDGNKVGTDYEFYESGAKKYEQPYVAGKKHGKWYSWYENGQKWTERDFNMDQLDGKVLVWDTDGTLTKEYVYVKGQMIEKNHYFEEN